jgi:hypothetical protein
MRPIYGIALTLLLAAPLSAPAFAVEPDAPQALISRSDAIRIAVQTRLAEKFTATARIIVIGSTSFQKVRKIWPLPVRCGLPKRSMR